MGAGEVRVMHCLETVGSGGVEQRRLSLAKHLCPMTYRQQLVCTQAIGGLPARLEQAGCKIHEVGTFKGIFDRRPYRATLRHVREFQPHIIHGAVYEGVAQAAVTGRLGRVPVIIGEETSDPQNRTWKGSLFYRGLAGLCHHMIGVSPAVVDYLVNTIHLPERKVTLVNNGVAEKPPAQPEDVARVRASFDLPADACVIGTVGRLFDGPKRVSDLIRAMPRIVGERPDAVLLVVGTGPDETALRALARDLGVADRIRFAGYQSDPQPFYQAMDVFALASAHEAFGLVLVEAMFAALPVVATRVGGIPGIVEELHTGYLVERYQPDALARAILTLAHDETTRCGMGRNGRARARERFTVERYVRDVEDLYQRLLAEHKVT